MIENSLESLFYSINNSEEYHEYKKITSSLKDNKKIITLIEEIKNLEKEATRLEYNKDDKYLEIDEEIKNKLSLLNNDKDYQKYLSKLKKFNSVLTTSSMIVQDYVDSKVSI